MPGLTHRAIVATLPVVPRRVVEPFARPYVAGETLDHAVEAVESLAARGRMATLDVLGEELRDEAEVRALVDTYRTILARPIAVAEPPTLSVRMTALGLRIDSSLPWGHLEELALAARDAGRELTIDMEDSTTLEATLDHYRRLRDHGHDHVGIVLQAYLRRTPGDLRELAELAPRVRVVKGIWVEPQHVAYDDREIIRRNYVRMLDQLLGYGSYVEIATHDEWLVAEALHLLDRHGREPHEYEFQMLLGVREELGDVIVAGGHRLRVYVPFGEEWHGYCVRRLKESPDVAKHVIRASAARLLRR